MLGTRTRDGKMEGVVTDFHRNLLEEIQKSFKPLHSEKKNSLLDIPYVKKQKPKQTKLDNCITSEITENKNSKQSKIENDKSLDNCKINDDMRENKLTRISQFSNNKSMKYLVPSNVDKKDNFMKMMNRSVSKDQTKNESFYELEKDRKLKKDLDLESMRNKKREEESLLLKEKPTMNEISRQIIRKKFNEEKPLYLRTSEIIDKKNLTIKTIQRLVQEKEDLEITKSSVLSTKNNNNLSSKSFK